MVYSCLEDKMYTGRKGKGAFCDGEKLQVSDQTGKPSAVSTSLRSYFCSLKTSTSIAQN